MADAYDLVVIGAGTGGYVAAIRAAQLGLKTAVIERQPALGGTCLIWGCIPTKALLEHAHALKLVQEASQWGIGLGTSGPPTIDMAHVNARKDKIVGGLTRGVEYLFKKNGIDWVRGAARLAGAGRVEVTGEAARVLTAREILVATGSRPRALPAIAVDHVRILTSDDAIGLSRVPSSMAILGSGAVGVEFASIFRRFGCEVTLVELLPRLTPNEDAAVSAELERAFRKRGIAVRTGTRVTGARVDGAQVRVTVQNVTGTFESLDVDTVLVAIGREPVTDGLGAAEAGLTIEQGYIKVDELYRTGVDGISAIGDVITVDGLPSHPQLAHVSSAEGIVVAERLAGRAPQPIDYDQIPSCTYCDPEVASVGLTEAEARSRGYDVRVGTFPFSALGRARIAGETEGFVKIVGESRYDQLLGVHIIGPRATELIAEGTAALRLEATVEDLIRTVHAHPTLSEAIGEAAHDLRGGAINV
jgi:dihydrolipoamide dehydrogenase